jgi:hypothetical protein
MLSISDHAILLLYLECSNFFMKKIYLSLVIMFCCAANAIYAQNVAINSDGSAADASAMLDVKSTSKGMLIPRVALTGRTDVTTIPSPANSLMIYNVSTAGSGSSAVVPGYYYWNSPSWIHVGMTTNAAITGDNNFVVENTAGQVGSKKGYGAVALNYIICVSNATFPCNTGCSTGANLDVTMLGEIKLFAGNFAPQNWAFCNGQIMAININLQLFSILGTTYGGNGVTTFSLPDLRSAVPLHFGTATSGKNWDQGEKQD